MERIFTLVKLSRHQLLHTVEIEFSECALIQRYVHTYGVAVKLLSTVVVVPNSTPDFLIVKTTISNFSQHLNTFYN